MFAHFLFEEIKKVFDIKYDAFKVEDFGVFIGHFKEVIKFEVEGEDWFLAALEV